MLGVGYAAGNKPATQAAPDIVKVASEADAPAGQLDRAAVEAIVRDYLLKNPELLLEVQDALETKQKEEQKLASEGVIKSQKDELFNSAFDGVVGNPKGKVTIVEFYDYNCGFCKRAIEDMQALTKADPGRGRSRSRCRWAPTRRRCASTCRTRTFRRRWQRPTISPTS